MTARRVKWGAHGSDVIPMWIAEMDCGPCPAVVDAVSAAVTAGRHRLRRDEEYAVEVAAFAERRVGVGLRPRGR